MLLLSVEGRPVVSRKHGKSKGARRTSTPSREPRSGGGAATGSRAPARKPRASCARDDRRQPTVLFERRRRGEEDGHCRLLAKEHPKLLDLGNVHLRRRRALLEPAGHRNRAVQRLRARSSAHRRCLLGLLARRRRRGRSVLVGLAGTCERPLGRSLLAIGSTTELRRRGRIVWRSVQRRRQRGRDGVPVDGGSSGWCPRRGRREVERLLRRRGRESGSTGPNAASSGSSALTEFFKNCCLTCGSIVFIFSRTLAGTSRTFCVGRVAAAGQLWPTSAAGRGRHRPPN